MLNNSEIIEIDNFNLKKFGLLLTQSLNVVPQLMLEFNGNMIRSCSMSNSKALIKLWTVPIQFLIVDKKEKEENTILDIDAPTIVKEPFNINTKFDFYVLKGTDLLKYIEVFDKNQPVKLTINVRDNSTSREASTITILGKTSEGTMIETTFSLTTEALISEKIDDYSKIMEIVKPSEDSLVVNITAKIYKEICDINLKLHKAEPNNSAYITLRIFNDRYTVNDKVFELEYKLLEPLNIEDGKCIELNILKSDFMKISAETLSMHFSSDPDDPKIVFITKYFDSIIYSLITKARGEIATSSNDDDFADDLVLSDYGLTDEIPF